MSVLIHTCCAPCLVYPAKELERSNVGFTVYFFNPNIHPYREFKKRLDCLVAFCSENNHQMMHDPDYGLREFLRSVIYRERSRCRVCYYMRLKKTVQTASENGFDYFSSTLLYSKYQNHFLLKSLAEQLSAYHCVPFYYCDFRQGWEVGNEMSITLGLYRQKYCGCIFSEQERYDNRLKKKLKKKARNNV